MADDAPLTDKEVHERLTQARHALGDAAGATVHGDTVLSTARAGLAMWSAALVRLITEREP